MASISSTRTLPRSVSAIASGAWAWYSAAKNLKFVRSTAKGWPPPPSAPISKRPGHLLAETVATLEGRGRPGHAFLASCAAKSPAFAAVAVAQPFHMASSPARV